MQKSPGRSFFLLRISLVFFVLLGFSCMAYGIPPKPSLKQAKWSGQTWGTARALPQIVKLGEQVHVHGMVVGGPASDPYWSCSQYEAWKANGTATIAVKVPGTWSMPHVGRDIFGNLVNIEERDGGDEPPYGWDNRISDTCYCYVDHWGAHGGCESREVQPLLFFMMNPTNPREGNVQFATVNSGSGWVAVEAHFSGTVGVPHADYAQDYVYVVADESQLQIDSDNDGLPDAWEYAHSPNNSLDDFAGGPQPRMKESENTESGEWIDPYSPKNPGWIPAGENDFDGDGLSNLQEYQLWNSGAKDIQDYPYDPAFINFTSSFPFSLILPAIMNSQNN